MAVGLGIHGEPGLDEVAVPTAEGLAELFVSKLLEEVPGGENPRGRRVVVIINGLGAFKLDEMFAVYGEVSKKLNSVGLDVADIKVGEFCTSFEMAGVSMTLFWLDDELERLWLASSQSPEYSVGERVAGYKKPRHLFVRQSLDRTQTGKVPLARIRADAAEELALRAAGART